MTIERVDRHDPQARCQRTECGHQRAVHVGRHFASSWTVCTEAGCTCWYFEDGKEEGPPSPARPDHDNPQVDKFVDKRQDDPADLDVVTIRAGDADQLTTAGWQRGYQAGWNASLDSALTLLNQYGRGDHGTRAWTERQRIMRQLEHLKK